MASGKTKQPSDSDSRTRQAACDRLDRLREQIAAVRVALDVIREHLNSTLAPLGDVQQALACDVPDVSLPRRRRAVLLERWGDARQAAAIALDGLVTVRGLVLGGQLRASASAARTTARQLRATADRGLRRAGMIQTDERTSRDGNEQAADITIDDATDSEPTTDPGEPQGTESGGRTRRGKSARQARRIAGQGGRARGARRDAGDERGSPSVADACQAVRADGLDD